MDTREVILPSTYGVQAPYYPPVAPVATDGLLGGGGLGALLIGALLFGGRGFGGIGGGIGGGYGYGGPAAAAVATDSVLDSQFDCLSNQIGSLSNQLGSHATQSSIHNVSDEILTTSAAIQTAIATGNFTTLNSINGLGRDVTAQVNQNALQQLNSFNVLSSAMQQGFNTSNIATLTGFNNLAMQNVTATNQIIAQGTALSSQLATCCCDIQNAICRDGDETRALINAINLQNIQGQLNDAKAQISNFQQTQTLLDQLTRREVKCGDRCCVGTGNVVI